MVERGGRGCTAEGIVLEWSGNLDWMSKFYQIMKGFGSWKAGH